MTHLTATTTIEIELTGRRPTIADVRHALDVFDAEGIPDTFEVEIYSRLETDYDAPAVDGERRTFYRFSIKADRGSVEPAPCAQEPQRADLTASQPLGGPGHRRDENGASE